MLRTAQSPHSSWWRKFSRGRCPSPGQGTPKTLCPSPPPAKTGHLAFLPPTAMQRCAFPSPFKLCHWGGKEQMVILSGMDSTARCCTETDGPKAWQSVRKCSAARHCTEAEIVQPDHKAVHCTSLFEAGTSNSYNFLPGLFTVHAACQSTLHLRQLTDLQHCQYIQHLIISSTQDACYGITYSN